MEISIIKAEKIHMMDCADAILKSELGRVYFHEKDKAIRALSDGISKGEICIAINNDSTCLGFIWLFIMGLFTVSHICIS